MKIKNLIRKSVLGFVAVGFLVSFVACDKKTDSKKSSGEESYDAELQLLKKLESKTDTATLTETKKEEPKVDLNSFESHKNKHANYRFSYSASSYLVETLSSGTTSYSPDNLATKIGTPWVPKNLNGKNGIGETVTLKGAWDNHLCLAVRNGFQTTRVDDIYEKNSRVKTFDISCQESDLSMTVNMYDSKDTQVVDIREILPKSEVPSITINLKIIDAYSGSKYSDLCIDSIVPYFVEESLPSKVQIVSDADADKNIAIDKAENANNWMWKCKLFVPAGTGWKESFTLEELYSGLSENTVMETEVVEDRIGITTTVGAEGIKSGRSHVVL